MHTKSNCGRAIIFGFKEGCYVPLTYVRCYKSKFYVYREKLKENLFLRTKALTSQMKFCWMMLYDKLILERKKIKKISWRHQDIVKIRILVIFSDVTINLTIFHNFHTYCIIIIILSKFEAYYWYLWWDIDIQSFVTSQHCNQKQAFIQLLAACRKFRLITLENYKRDIIHFF